MKRRTFQAAAVAATIALLSACGGGDEAPAPVMTVDASGASSIDVSALSAQLSTYPIAPLSAAEARALEPHVRCTAALWSPDTGIVDSHRLMASLLADAEAHGATAVWRHEVRAAEPVAGGYHVVALGPDGEEATLAARWVVNAAGLDAENSFGLPGHETRVREVRGEGMVLLLEERVPERCGLAARPVRPVGIETVEQLHEVVVRGDAHRWLLRSPQILS